MTVIQDRRKLINHFNVYFVCQVQFDCSYVENKIQTKYDPKRKYIGLHIMYSLLRRDEFRDNRTKISTVLKRLNYFINFE